MSKRHTVSVTLLSVFALTITCFLSAAAQKGPQGTASSVKPVKGIDVVVMKNPGNSAAHIVTTDSDGTFKFPVLEAGSYSLRLSRSVDVSVNGRRKDIAMNSIRNLKRENSPSTEEIKTCVITILGAEGGTRTEGWNLETNRIIIKDSVSAKSVAPGEKIDVVSDGKTPLTGSVDTFIIKSKSNISSN